jgi:F-type H+-transporting ATPase subunit b
MVLDPLDQIHLVTTTATVVIFLVTLFVLRRVVFLPVIEVMERRSARIEAAQLRKAEAEALLRGAQVQADEAMTSAKAEAARILAGAREEMSGTRRERMAKANTEAEAILALGREEVATLRAAAEARLAEELHSSVGKALTAMIGPVEDPAVRLMVNRALATGEGG